MTVRYSAHLRRTKPNMGRVQGSCPIQCKFNIEAPGTSAGGPAFALNVLAIPALPSQCISTVK